MFKLSIIIPVFNEERTLKKVIESLKIVPWESYQISPELIIVIDPKTSDNSAFIAQEFIDVLCLFPEIGGKGAAIRYAADRASGDYIGIQDADLEYSFEDYPLFLKELQKRKDDVLLLGRRRRRFPLTFREALAWFGSLCITCCLSLFYRKLIFDQACMFKFFPRALIKKYNICRSGFDFEIELICKALKESIPFVQIPVRYVPRSYREGKKLNLLKDGVAIFTTLWRLRFSKLFDIM